MKIMLCTKDSWQPPAVAKINFQFIWKKVKKTFSPVLFAEAAYDMHPRLKPRPRLGKKNLSKTEKQPKKKQQQLNRTQWTKNNLAAAVGRANMTTKLICRTATFNLRLCRVISGDGPYTLQPLLAGINPPLSQSVSVPIYTFQNIFKKTKTEEKKL